MSSELAPTCGTFMSRPVYSLSYFNRGQNVLKISPALYGRLPVIGHPGHVEEGDPLVLGVEEADQDDGGQEAHEQEQAHPKE